MVAEGKDGERMNEYMGLLFDWDTAKDAANRKKHGIGFDEAMTAFGDPNQQIYADEEHSDSEDRFVLLGYSEAAKLLIVCHCYRNGDSVTRIFSARKATPRERRTYERGGMAT